MLSNAFVLRHTPQRGVRDYSSRLLPTVLHPKALKKVTEVLLSN